jgi:hypothetical protein
MSHEQQGAPLMAFCLQGFFHLPTHRRFSSVTGNEKELTGAVGSQDAWLQLLDTCHSPNRYGGTNFDIREPTPS